MVGVSRKKKEAIVEKKKLKPHFFTVIVKPALQLNKMRLPKKFVREHGKNVPDHVYVRAPNGIDWPVEILRSNGEIWLQRGWSQFAEYYSLATGHLLVFKYDSRTKFQVSIFNSSTLEIDYPDNNLHQSDEQVIDDDNTSSEIQQKSGKSSKDDRVLPQAKAFQTRNVNSVIVCITKRNLKFNSGPVLAASHCRKYYKRSDNDTTVALCVNKNCWNIKIRMHTVASFHAALSSGWRDFALQNDLREGDNCVLELVDLATKTYNVKIFRVSQKMDEWIVKDKEINDDDHIYMSSMDFDRRVMVKANAFVGDGRGFIIDINKSYADLNSPVHVPLHHSKRYLKDKGDDQNTIVIHAKDERSWKIKYQCEGSCPKLSSGSWRMFRQDHHLKIGDVCAFKLIDKTKMAYTVAIFRGHENSE